MASGALQLVCNVIICALLSTQMDPATGAVSAPVAAGVLTLICLYTFGFGL